jgi:hypothetical protein
MNQEKISPETKELVQKLGVLTDKIRNAKEKEGEDNDFQDSSLV